MKSKSAISTMEVISPSERKALYKLVQRATEIMKEQWIQDCMIAFGWTRADAEFHVEAARRRAKRTLNATD